MYPYNLMKEKPAISVLSLSRKNINCKRDMKSRLAKKKEKKEGNNV